MKGIATIVSVLALALASCNSPTSTTAPTTAQASDFFYPPVNGEQYIYTQNNVSAPTDTQTYQVVVGASYGSYAKLVSQDQQSTSPSVLYYYKVNVSQAGDQCILSSTGSDQGIIALEGSLSLGSTWPADAAGDITATVVGRYAQYFLPGRTQMYTDVVAVKYVNNNSDSSYVLRLFALGYGLILERTVSTTATTQPDLQLISRLYSTNSILPDPHGHWYDERGGRYMMQMDPNYDQK